MEDNFFIQVVNDLVRLPNSVITWSCSSDIKFENPATPERVIYNDPYTIVYFVDGDKIIIKAEGDKFNKEFGLAMAIARKVIGTRNGFKRFIENAKVQEPKEV